MKYRFTLTYTETDEVQSHTRTCFPVHNDDLAISIERENDEWYYTRKLDGKLVFERDDYDWIMGQAFDGTFEMTIYESHDNGENWYDYFNATFSRASMEIDEDNRTATINGLKEGIADILKNGAKEDYDLMKLIPDSQCKTVQCQIPPALALVDYNSTEIEHSDMFYQSPIISGGYDETGFKEDERVISDENWSFLGILADAEVIMKNEHSIGTGLYKGILHYTTVFSSNVTPVGLFSSNTPYTINLRIGLDDYHNYPVYEIEVYYNGTYIYSSNHSAISNRQSPTFLQFGGRSDSPYQRIRIYFHYIRATLLTRSSSGVQKNILNTGEYYKGMDAFNNDGGLQITITSNTSELPTGYPIVPGSADDGGIPKYFAPPDNSGWIPLAEDNWNYASMWYRITPSVTNGLLDPTKYGSFTYSRCWTIGTCIKYLLQRITSERVVFTENTDYSQFLYGNPNPVEGHEPFQWLVTQKSNVMHPAATGAARCIVRLDWFLELLTNAFNCYYWLEKRNDGKYDFRIEHVEYFRRGGAYSGQFAAQLDLTRLKPYRNFLRGGQPAKRYADQTNKYTFDLDNMAEKYTFSWQGDGGSDDFKGNPMYFKAGWIEKGSSDDRQVDNIFADLGWLMLNAGSDTASSKNYDGLFLFGGYRPINTIAWSENQPPTSQTLTLASGMLFTLRCDIWLTAPLGHSIYLNDGSIPIPIYTGTGQPQRIPINISHVGSALTVTLDFGADYNDVVIHRIHARSGDVYRVPNVTDLLNTDNTIQNGVLAWPWLQNEYLHYDIPARKWTYMKNEYTDDQGITWKNNGTIKMVKKQTVGVVPVPDAGTENNIMGIMGIKTGLGIGIIDSARINLSSRNAEMTIIYDINPQNN